MKDIRSVAEALGMPGMGRERISVTGPMDERKPPIGEKEIAEAEAELERYKKCKESLEQRIVTDELWYELRHWEVMRTKRKRPPHESPPEPSSAWLFNSIANKHADAMDNYPEPLILPRERSDEESAKLLSSVVPVILEYNGYESVYSSLWWEKLKHGTGAVGVFWNPAKQNGLGDVDVCELDLLKVFWEPGITDIQQSKNLFIVELADVESLERAYPQHKGKLEGRSIDVKQYIYDDTVDVERSRKAVVVDWYYKRRTPEGRTILHYAKFVGATLLFASENEPEYADTGWYEHGMYPVVFDNLFPEKGTPVGFGYVAIWKDPQMYIDKLSANILESSMMATKKRYMISTATGVNKEQFLNWSEPLVQVEGPLDDARVREITHTPISQVYLDVLRLKIDELKDTSANRDVNSGGSAQGVTAAAAIAALHEAGNKMSRDMISSSYRAHEQTVQLIIELIRQFYDEKRSFRIAGAEPGEYGFVDFGNEKLKDQPMPELYAGQAAEPDYTPVYRRPIFDIKITAQKKNPFSRMEQNQRAQELYGMGFFNPERAEEALGALEMMEFEGIDKVRDRVKQGQTLSNLCKQMSEQLETLSAAVAQLTGAAPQSSPASAGAQSAAASAPVETQGGGQTVSGQIMRAQTPMTSYGQALAERSRPSIR